jgi:hypothetical protein
MDLSPNWDPSEKGHGLPPFPALQGWQEYVPTRRHHKPWAQRTLGEELLQAPEGYEVLWQSVLALWRLKQLSKELDDPEDDFLVAWRLYAAAWLVGDHKCFLKRGTTDPTIFSTVINISVLISTSARSKSSRILRPP